MAEVAKMINDLISAFREEGIEIPKEAATAAEVKIRQVYGGERVYVASLPKQKRAVQLAKLAKRTQVEMALATGLTVRGVRKILRGK